MKHLAIILIFGWIIFSVHKPPIETLVSIENYIEPTDTFRVAATVYHATVAQTNSEPNITAFGYCIDTTQADKYRYIAISRDLEEYFSKGDTVIVIGTWVYDGMWIVADRMNERWSNKIDFLIQRGQYQDNFKNVKMVRK